MRYILKHIQICKETIARDKQEYGAIFISILITAIAPAFRYAHLDSSYNLIAGLCIILIAGIVVGGIYCCLLSRVIGSIAQRFLKITVRNFAILHAPLFLFLLFPFDMQINGIAALNAFLPIIILLFMSYIIFLTILIKNKPFLQPGNVFLTALLLGFVIIFVTPPYEAPDESSHFFRSYSISDFKIVNQKIDDRSGDNLPLSLKASSDYLCKDIPFHSKNKITVAEILSDFNRKLEPENTGFTEFPVHVLYSPIPYIPQAIGIGLGKLFELPPVALSYLGRIVSFLTWALLIFCAITIIPFYKWAILMVGLIPISIFLGASLSADAITNSISLMFFSIIMKRISDKEWHIRQKHFLILLFFITFIIILTKNAYFLIPMGLYLLIDRPMISQHHYLRLSVIYFVFCIGILFAWSMSVSSLYVPLNNSNPAQQLAFIISDPFRFIKMLGADLFGQGYLYIKNLGRMGWLDVQVKEAYLNVYFIILIALCLIDGKKDINIPLYKKIILLMIFIGTTVVVQSVMYLTWTPPGKHIILGVSGRYFIPVLPSALLLLYNKKLAILVEGQDKKIAVAVLIVSYSMILLTIATLIMRYYIPSGVIPGY